VVLDPFAGSGTTLVAAAKHGRRWVGVELSKDYAAGAAERIAEEGVPDAAPPPAPVLVSRRRRRGRKARTAPRPPGAMLFP
jgi:site-specific DNA-methyltransferase (adenine-specific)